MAGTPPLQRKLGNMANPRFTEAGISRTLDAIADGLAILVLTVRYVFVPNRVTLRPLRVRSTDRGLTSQVRR